MANFLIPFGRDSEKRLPNNDERTLGFPCGPADQRLFNGLFNRIESEIGHVIDYAGLTPTDSSFTQLREAIEAIISAATGGGDTSQFLLMAQARARLPIFPEIVSADYRMNVTSPAAGTVRIPGGVIFMHRGVFPITTAQTDFATTANKTYHVRWSVASGYQLKDLTDVAYNPTAAAEGATVFDTSYDNMLIARVITNSSNVPTITNLANAAFLSASGGSQGPGTPLDPTYGSTYSASLTLNWGRAPRMWVPTGNMTSSGGPSLEWANFVGGRTASRYSVAAIVSSNWLESMPAMSTITGVLNFDAMG